MKININALIDLNDLTFNMDRKEVLELIKNLDLDRGEEDFTFDIINMLIKSLMEDDGLNKSYILKELKFGDTE